MPTISDPPITSLRMAPLRLYCITKWLACWPLSYHPTLSLPTDYNDTSLPTRCCHGLINTPSPVNPVDTVFSVHCVPTAISKDTLKFNFRSYLISVNISISTNVTTLTTLQIHGHLHFHSESMEARPVSWLQNQIVNSCTAVRDPNFIIIIIRWHAQRWA